MQKPFPSDAAPLGTTPSEDCLTVNVWTPRAERRVGKLPVVVWIHGGGFVNGGASPAVYDGSAFARDGVVFVSFNYRLGRFGFFAHPALSHEDPESVGNFALQDQIAALGWIKRNIAQFGGDPAHVTIMGESAGGASVISLLASEKARGLFHRAIVMSGGGRRVMPALHDTAGEPAVSAETMGMHFARTVGIAGTNAVAAKALRDLPADHVVNGLNLGNRPSSASPDWTGGPIVDGHVLLQSSEATMTAGRGTPVPLMIGVTDDDLGRYDATTKEALLAPFGLDAPQVAQAYDPDGQAPFAAMARALSRDMGMTEPARFVAQWAVRADQPVYRYNFAYVAQSLRDEGRGARHASDIPFFFDTVATKYGDRTASRDRQAAALAHSYVVNFVKKGNPNDRGLPDWRPFTVKSQAMMDFRHDGSGATIADPLKTRLDILERIQSK